MARIIGVGNAPCSWGVLEFDLEGEPMGFERVLDEMATSGYAGTDLGDWGFMPTDPDVLQSELERRSLSLISAFIPVSLADPEALHTGRQTALQIARLLLNVGGETAAIVLSDDNGMNAMRTHHAGRISPSMGWNPQQWETAAHTANHIALSVYEETGLRTVFHPHCAGFVETPEEVGLMMEATHPRMLGLCLDTAHCAYGGGDPLEQIRHYGDRIWLVHFKGYHAEIAAMCRSKECDYFEAIHQGVFCELEESSLDFQAVLNALNEIDYAGWIVVEQDMLPGMGNALESATKNRAFLKTLGL